MVKLLTESCAEETRLEKLAKERERCTADLFEENFHSARLLAYSVTASTFTLLGLLYAGEFVSAANQAAIILFGALVTLFWLANFAEKIYWKWREPQWIFEIVEEASFGYMSDCPAPCVRNALRHALAACDARKKKITQRRRILAAINCSKAS